MEEDLRNSRACRRREQSDQDQSEQSRHWGRSALVAADDVSDDCPCRDTHGVSDVEHELIVEHGALRDRAVRLGSIARRSLAAAIRAQDRSLGRHDPWLDEAMRTVLSEVA